MGKNQNDFFTADISYYIPRPYEFEIVSELTWFWSNISELIFCFYFAWKYKIKHQCRNLLFNKAARCRPAPLLKRHCNIFIFLWILKGIVFHIKCSYSFSIFLTHFIPMVSFYTPWKHKKTYGLLMFPGYIERDL